MEIKKIPYGLSDYKRIKEENYYFVDKSKFIEKLENLNENFAMFLRPRRFGKSLFVALLEAYYDKHYKKDFELLFGDTYIGKNLTPKASSYLIMRFDFSSIDISNVENSFQDYIFTIMKGFIFKYDLKVDIVDNPINLFNRIFEYLKENSLELYLLIDEYDNFANKLLLLDRDNYLNIVSKKTASFKQFFTTLKSATSGNDSPLKRIFITGVTPMTMYDVTSGFNIGYNISLRYEFNEMVGFNQDEVDELLNYYGVDIDKNILKEWYDNYIFNYNTKESVYNTDMILYFISNYQANRDKIPDEMIDINVRSDYSKLRNIIYTNKKLNGNFDNLRTLIAGEEISINNLVQDFSALNLEKRDNFKSLMFYLGLVTIKDKTFNLNLTIPNETVKRIDIDFLNNSLELEKIFKIDIDLLEEYFSKFALEGNLEIFKFLAKQIKQNSGIRDYITKEQHIKAMYIAYLSFTSYYITKSEPELNKGFADIFIKPFNNPYVKFFALVEVKYINKKLKNRKKIEEKRDELIKDAQKQLKKYEKDILVQEYLEQGLTLKKIILIFHGWKLIKIMEI